MPPESFMYAIPYEYYSKPDHVAFHPVPAGQLDAGYPAVDHPDDAPNHAGAFDVRIAEGQVPDGRGSGIAHHEAEQPDAYGLGAVDGYAKLK